MTSLSIEQMENVQGGIKAAQAVACALTGVATGLTLGGPTPLGFGIGLFYSVACSLS